jgi:glycosyltransferase involved in cell wall biosynthesis
MKTLYLCYFGLREPLVQTQVLPYLRQLAAAGIGVSLLTFEPQMKQTWSQEELETQAKELSKERITWISRPYHKRPSLPATAFDVVVGAWVAARLARSRRIDVLHARSHLPLAMALLARAVTRCRLIFDVRGLMAEEYVDIGNWKADSLPFRLIKALERIGLRQADQVVVLTRRMRDWLVKEDLADAGRIVIIPCCTDVRRFESPAPAESVSNRLEVVYAGTATGLHLLEEVGRFFIRLRERQPNAFLRILTHSPAADIVDQLKRLGLKPDDFAVVAAQPDEVPPYFGRARIGVSFRKATFAQIAASPAKIPEYLAAGLPVISNSGIGDLDDLLTNEGVGFVIQNFHDEAYEEAAEQILKMVELPDIRQRCQRVARKYFDLIDVGGKGYLEVYRRIALQTK